MDTNMTELRTLSAVFDTRRANLRLLADRYDGPSQLAAKLQLRHPSYLSQLIGPNPSRDISERTARAYEEKLGLAAGWLDVVRG